MTDYLTKFLGSTTHIRTKKWGKLKLESAKLSPTADGDFVVHVGKPSPARPTLVRIHSTCVFSESFGSEECDCADQLDLAMLRLKQEGAGLLFYLRLEGRGAGLAAKIRANALELEGIDTYDSRLAIGVDPDSRSYEGVAQFLKERGYSDIRLLTNNPSKADDLVRAGLRVNIESIFIADPSKTVAKLYEAKRRKFGHILPNLIDRVQSYLFDFDDLDRENGRG